MSYIYIHFLQVGCNNQSTAEMWQTERNINLWQEAWYYTKYNQLKVLLRNTKKLVQAKHSIWQIKFLCTAYNTNILIFGDKCSLFPNNCPYKTFKLRFCSAGVNLFRLEIFNRFMVWVTLIYYVGFFLIHFFWK